MTIAIDRTTNEILGQYLDNQPGVRDDRGRIVSAVPQVLLLTGNGYITVPAASVRLEVLR